MAISYVGGIVAAVAGSTSDTVISLSGTLTGGSDSSPSAGDLVVVTIAVGHTGDAVTTDIITADYTELTALTADDTRDIRLMTGYKFMGGTPDTDVTISGSDVTTAAMAYTVQVFRGVDISTPMDVAVVTATGLSLGRPDPDAITPVTDGAWIVVCTGATTTTSATFTYSDMTNVLSVYSNDTDDVIIGSGYNDTWTSGAFDPVASSTGSISVNDCWAAYTLALRPSSGTGVLDSDATATVTWGSRSTAASRQTIAATATASWNGASIARSNASITNTASVTWNGLANVFSAAAFSATAAASLTWNSRTFIGAPFSSVAVALQRWNGATINASAFDQDAVAEQRWNGASRIAAALTVDARAVLIWNGRSTISAACDIDAVASLTWNGEEVTNVEAAAAWSSTAAATASWNGASSNAAALSSTAVASVSWSGTGIFPGAVDIDAAASLTWTGVTLANASWESNAVSAQNWNGSATVSAAYQSTALAVLTWNGTATAESAWRADTLGVLEWEGFGEGTPTTEDATFQIVTTAFVEFTAEVIAAAAFDIEAVSTAAWSIPKPPPRVLDGRRLSHIEDGDEEDIMLFMAAINTYLEQEHDDY